MTLVFCIHYFLWVGAMTTISGYESVYARHYTNATTMQFGYLNMLLPFVTVLVTPVICSSADRNRSHRAHFTATMVVTTITLCLYALLPLALNLGILNGEVPVKYSNATMVHNLFPNHVPQIPEKTGNLLLGPWICFCLISLTCEVAAGINTCLSDSFAVLHAEERGSSFGRVVVWGTLGWASSAVILSLINQEANLPRLVPGLLFGASLMTINVIVMIFWPNSRDFELDSSSSDAATKSLSIASKNPEATNVTLPVDNQPDLVGSAPTQGFKEESKPVINDSEPIADGRFDKSVTSFKMQFILLGLILMRRKALIRYLIVFVISGLYMSMHKSYFFLYLEMIYENKFEFISGLSMVGQSLLGELPFFILSRRLIDLLGQSHTLSISMISIGIRFLLYAYLLPNASMYFIVSADWLQGPNRGLFYVAMTEVGLDYSYCDEQTIEMMSRHGVINPRNKHQVDSLRQSLTSTVRSLTFACYEGLGAGLGSLIGGWIVATWGFEVLWISSALGAILVGFINLLIELLCREFDPGIVRSRDFRDDSDRRAFVEARRRGTLEYLVSSRDSLKESAQTRQFKFVTKTSKQPPSAKQVNEKCSLPKN